MRTEADLDALEDALSSDREVRRGEDGAIRTTDPLGFGLAFRVARNRAVAAPEQDFNVPGRAARVNRRAARVDCARPLEISHVVYVTDELEAHKEFYVDRLGFRVTDMYPGRGYFTRCSAAHHHHNLFLLDPGAGKRGFHHVAFEVGTIHELFGGGNNMTRQGWKTMLGPGPPPDLVLLFLVFPQPLGGRGGVRLRLGRGRRRLGGRELGNRSPRTSPSGALPKAWARRSSMTASSAADTGPRGPRPK